MQVILIYVKVSSLYFLEIYLEVQIIVSKYYKACFIQKNQLFYLHFPSASDPTFVCFFPVGLSLLIQHFQGVLWVLKLPLSPGLGSWQLEFKSLIIIIVGFKICLFVCCFLKPTITIISDLNSNCQMPKPGDRSKFNTYKTFWKCCIKNEWPTGKKHSNIGWDDGGK
jgi:hypothetical protein